MPHGGSDSALAGLAPGAGVDPALLAGSFGETAPSENRPACATRRPTKTRARLKESARAGRITFPFSNLDADAFWGAGPELRARSPAMISSADGTTSRERPRTAVARRGIRAIWLHQRRCGDRLRQHD